MATMELFALYALMFSVWVFYSVTNRHQRHRWLWKGVTGLLLVGLIGFALQLAS